MRKLAAFFVNGVAIIATLYLVFVATGAYNIILSILTRVVAIPEKVVLTSQHHMSFLLALSLLYIFLTTPARKGGKVGAVDCALGLVAFTASIYRFVVYHELSLRIGITTLEDVLFGWITVISIIEAIRRRIGPELAAVVTAFVAYGLWDVGFDLKLFAERIYVYNIGIYSTPLQVAVLMISVFLLFGALLEQSGAAEYFSRLAVSLAGKRRGGPAKVTVLSSALLGTSTGSATGATAIIGTITIPTMIKLGLSPEVSAAITAACGTGSQIMPPVLGSAAFIMPLYLGTSYWTVVIASIVPALLYYLYFYLYVDLMSKKLGLRGLPQHEIPRVREVIREIYMFAPVALLIYLLSAGFEAGTAALGSLLAVLAIAALRQGKSLGILVLALFTTILIGFAYFLNSVTSSIMLTSALAVILTISLRGSKSTGTLSDKLVKGFSRAFREASSIILTCAGAGIIAGVLSLSGLSYTLGHAIWNISGGNMYVVLLMVMLIAILLGFGLPTPVVYVTVVSILGGLAMLLPIPKISLHYFIFFFGVFAPLTPPVALATFAAASIAKANFWKAGMTAFAMTLASWVIAWGFVLRPNLLLVTINDPSMSSIAKTVADILLVSATMMFLLVAYIGVTWWRANALTLPERLLYGAVAGVGFLSLVYDQLLTFFVAFFVLTLVATFVRSKLKGVSPHAS